MNNTRITSFDDINDLLQCLLVNLQSILGEKLVGIYIYGSLVWGDFIYHTSDIDLLVVTAVDIDENDFTTLNEMQDRLVKNFDHWDDRIEIAYLSKEALKTFKYKRSTIATISPGEPFNIKKAGIGWLVDWYCVQENSVTLFGPDPRTLIEPISKSEFLMAVKNHALEWREWVTQTKNSQGFQFYAVLTLCRAFYALNHGEQSSKTTAGQWAKKAYPQWADLIEKAITWRINPKDVKVDSTSTYPEVQRFVHEMLSTLK